MRISGFRAKSIRVTSHPQLISSRAVRFFLSFVLSLFTVLPHLHGASTVSGTVSGQRWTKANSPYNVTGDVLAGNLIIEAGVRVLMQSNYVFEVAGVLTVAGTHAEPVIFTRMNGSWQGIFFNF